MGSKFIAVVTLKGFASCLTLSGFMALLNLNPGFSLHSNRGLKVANAFGVKSQLIENCNTAR